MKRLLLVVMLLLFVTSCSFVENILDKFDIEIGKPKTERRRVTRTPQVVNRVYSYAYEGHLNIREKPSFKARIIGKFRNGPEGGNLLQDLGGWSQVEVNGVVGYVVSRYLKRTPTIPYTGRVGLSWIEGLWESTEDFDGAWYICLYNNGYFEYHCKACGEKGYYIMQNKEIKIVAVLGYDWDTRKYEWLGANSGGMILKIDERSGTLNHEYSSFRKVEFDGDAYADFGYGVPATKSLFRQSGQEVAKEVSAYMLK